MKKMMVYRLTCGFVIWNLVLYSIDWGWIWLAIALDTMWSVRNIKIGG